MRILGGALLLAGIAWGQGGLRQDAVLGADGRPAGGATVKVCRYDATPGEGSTSTTACSPAATIYADSALTSADADSIITADSSGNYKYYAVPGFYIEQVCKSGSCLARKIQVAAPPTGGSHTIDGQVSFVNEYRAPRSSGTVQQIGMMVDLESAASPALASGTDYRIAGAFRVAQGASATDAIEGLNVIALSRLGAPEVQVNGVEVSIANNQADDANACAAACHVGLTVSNTGAFKGYVGVGVGGAGQWRKAVWVSERSVSAGNSAFWYGGDGASGVARLRADGTWQLGFEGSGLGNPNELHLANNRFIQGLNTDGTALLAIASVNPSNRVSFDPGGAGAVFGGSASPAASGQDLGSRGARWDVFAAAADVGTSLTINGGAAITKHLSATASLDFDFSGAGITPQDLAVTVRGAAVGDVVALGLPAALQGSGIMCSAFVSATHTVTVRCLDVTSSGANPGAATVRVDVWQH